MQDCSGTSSETCRIHRVWTTTTRGRFSRVASARRPKWATWLMLLALEPPSGGVNDACARGGDTRRRAFRHQWSQPLHHSRDVGPAKDEALRKQKKTAEVEEAGIETHSGLRAPTPLPPGMRLEPLEEPLHWFIRGLEALCPDDDGAPSLSMPVLADRAADGVDSSSLQFLTASALEDRREEEERRKREEQEELHPLRAVPPERRTPEQVMRITDILLHRGTKRKRRRKRRTPRTPRTFSRSLRGRARRRQR